MMCRKPSLAATAAATALLALAPAAHARGLFGGKPAAKPAAPAAAPAKEAPQKADPAARATAETLDPLARAAFWAREVNADPTDSVAALRLASALRSLEKFDEAAQSVDRVLAVHPADEEALLEAARIRIAAQKGFYALDFLSRAEAAAPHDWRPWSLQGVAMEQTKRTAEARQSWERALQLSPDNPAVLSNMALSYAAAGDRGQAETLLRKAAAQPSATIKERQNLALVLGLSGKVGEAEGLIRHDLPPEIADANLAYLRGSQ